VQFTAAPSLLEISLWLENGRNQCEGHVELFYKGHCGTVCDDFWDVSDVQDICRQLGCGQLSSAPGAAEFGEGLELFSQVMCGAEDMKLMWGSAPTMDSQDITVATMKMLMLSVQVLAALFYSFQEFPIRCISEYSLKITRS